MSGSFMYPSVSWKEQMNIIKSTLHKQDSLPTKVKGQRSKLLKQSNSKSALVKNDRRVGTSTSLEKVIQVAQKKIGFTPILPGRYPL